MATMSSASPESLREAIVECIAVNAQELHQRIGNIAIGMSADHPDAGAHGLSAYDSGTRTLTILADRVIAGKEGVSLAREITRWHGARAVRAVMGDTLDRLMFNPEYSEQIDGLKDMTAVLEESFRYRTSAPEVLSLEQFRASRVYHANLDAATDGSATLPGYVYAGGCFIEKDAKGFILTIGNEGWIKDDLKELEKLLYEGWYLPECAGVREELQESCPLAYVVSSYSPEKQGLLYWQGSAWSQNLPQPMQTLPGAEVDFDRMLKTRPHDTTLAILNGQLLQQFCRVAGAERRRYLEDKGYDALDRQDPQRRVLVQAAHAAADRAVKAAGLDHVSEAFDAMCKGEMPGIVPQFVVCHAGRLGRTHDAPDSAAKAEQQSAAPVEQPTAEREPRPSEDGPSPGM